MISKRRHTRTFNGKPVYVIEAHVRPDPSEDPRYRSWMVPVDESQPIAKEFNGTRYKVDFRHGIGMTTSRAKAQLFSEQHHYIVCLHEDVDPWIEAKPGQPVVLNLEEDEDVVDVDDDDADVDEEE